MIIVQALAPNAHCAATDRYDGLGKMVVCAAPLDVTSSRLQLGVHGMKAGATRLASSTPPVDIRLNYDPDTQSLCDQ
jgi:hypothetical protein